MTFIKLYWNHQISDIKKGGWATVKRKAKTLFLKSIQIPLYLCALPVFLFVRIIRPVKLIRFGNLKSQRIGHLAANVELYLCEREHGLQPSDSIDIFYYITPVCNYQLLKMWKQVLRVNRIIHYLWWWNNNISGGDIHKITTIRSDRDVQGLMEKSKIHLHFTAEEKSEAQAGLRDMGIGKETPFVCLMARDSSYLNNNFPASDWYYHNYRDCNIQNYILAATELTARGYYVVRMGVEVQEAMDIDNIQVIDYAYNGHRTELLDIYLGANCRFFVNGMAGFGAIPYVFRRPILSTNWIPVEYLDSFNPKSITIFKKHWLKNEHRFMIIREIFESGAGRYLHTQDFDKHGIELIENTPEEIRDGVIEMDERLKGTWQTTEEDEELQRRFWDILPKSELNGVLRSRIGAEFLRQYQELLK